MLAAAMLAALSAGCVGAAAWLARARWPRRGPSSAILLWQALGSTWGLSAVGALWAVAVAPYNRGLAFGLAELTRPGSGLPLGAPNLLALLAGSAVLAVLLGALVLSALAVASARRRHRALLALLADGHPDVPGTLIVDHPGAAAYCVPGVRSRLVVSEGTLRLLARGELDAVLAHERAHARERHDLVLLPFSSLLRIFPRSRIVRDAHDAVSLLVEMRADDRAAYEQSRRQLATALLRFGVAGVPPAPAGALGAGDDPVVARAQRLLRPCPALPPRVRAVTWAASGLLAALPAVLALLPL